MSLVPRVRADPFRLSTLQVRLVAGALRTVEAPDRDLLAPQAYVPSQVCSAWADRLFPALSGLVLVQVWDPQRAQLRPRAVVRAPVPPHRSRRAPAADPWVGLPLAERTPVAESPVGPLLLALAGWLASCGGCTVGPG